MSRPSADNNSSRESMSHYDNRQATRTAPSGDYNGGSMSSRQPSYSTGRPSSSYSRPSTPMTTSRPSSSYSRPSTPMTTSRPSSSYSRPSGSMRSEASYGNYGEQVTRANSTPRPNNGYTGRSVNPGVSNRSVSQPGMGNSSASRPAVAPRGGQSTNPANNGVHAKGSYLDNARREDFGNRNGGSMSSRMPNFDNRGGNRPGGNGNRPGGNFDNRGGNRPGGNGNFDGRGGNRPGGNGNFDGRGGNRPGDRNFDDRGGHRPGDRDFGHRPGGMGPGHDPGRYDRFRYREGFRPRGGRPDGPMFDRYMRGWNRPWRPAPQPWRHSLWWYRPVIPVGFTPLTGCPIVDGIIGLYFGTAYDASLNFLYYNGYNIDGYYDNVIYLDNVNLFGYTWPDVMLNYDPVSGLNYAQFSYYMTYDDVYRYNQLYSTMYRTYGRPVQVVSGLFPAVTWVGGDGRGYVTLSRNYNNGRFYTSVSFGY